jgi:hypothetical protein
MRSTEWSPSKHDHHVQKYLMDVVICMLAFFSSPCLLSFSPSRDNSTGSALIIWEGSESKADWLQDALLFQSDDFRPGDLSKVGGDLGGRVCGGGGGGAAAAVIHGMQGLHKQGSTAYWQREGGGTSGLGQEAGS